VNDFHENAASVRKAVASQHGAAAKRDRASKPPVLEPALHLWFRHQEAPDLTITHEVLIGQASVFGTQEGIQLSASFDYSKDWLEGCKKRH
jgi:hypothetical protein